MKGKINPKIIFATRVFAFLFQCRRRKFNEFWKVKEIDFFNFCPQIICIFALISSKITQNAMRSTTVPNYLLSKCLLPKCRESFVHVLERIRGGKSRVFKRQYWPKFDFCIGDKLPSLIFIDKNVLYSIERTKYKYLVFLISQTYIKNI